MLNILKKDNTKKVHLYLAKVQNIFEYIYTQQTSFTTIPKNNITTHCHFINKDINIFATQTINTFLITHLCF